MSAILFVFYDLNIRLPNYCRRDSLLFDGNHRAGSLQDNVLGIGPEK